MGKVRYTIRLYGRHDLDLITFMQTHEFNIVTGVYCALTAFSNKSVFVMNIPPKKENCELVLKKSFTKTLTLDESKDMAAIQIMEKIQDGYHNCFLKNLLRQYLCYPLSETFLNNENDSLFFDESFDIFRQNRRTANAGTSKRRKKEEVDAILGISDNTSVNKKDKPIQKPQVEQKIIKPVQKEVQPEEIISDSEQIEIPAPDKVRPTPITRQNDDTDLTSLFAKMLG